MSQVLFFIFINITKFIYNNNNLTYDNSNPLRFLGRILYGLSYAPFHILVC